MRGMGRTWPAHLIWAMSPGCNSYHYTSAKKDGFALSVIDAPEKPMLASMISSMPSFLAVIPCRDLHTYARYLNKVRGWPGIICVKLAVFFLKAGSSLMRLNSGLTFLITEDGYAYMVPITPMPLEDFTSTALSSTNMPTWIPEHGPKSSALH